MSNYDPNLGPGRPGYDPTDPYHADPYRDPDSGRPGYVLLAALAGVALVGGFLYFGMPHESRVEQAQAPAPIERTVTQTPAATPGADRPAALPASPTDPSTPAPATTPAAPQE